MNNFIPEEKENPIVTLKAQAEKFDFSMLRVNENNDKAHSGETMFLDFHRMNFFVNKKSIDSTLTFALTEGAKENGLRKAWDEHSKNEKTPDDKKTDQYKKKFEELYNLGTNYAHLLPKEENGNYRPFAKAVFKEIFERAKVQVPSDPILEELVTNCNQAGYVGALYGEDKPLFHVIKAHELAFSSSHTTYIDCSDPSHATIRIEEKIAVCTLTKPEEELCKLDSSLEFTLQSQDEKDGITYKNGKLSLTAPKRLKDYNMGDKNLFDIIKECFQKLCEKFGFFKIKIGHELDKQLKVNSHLESVEPPAHSNEHRNAPGN